MQLLTKLVMCYTANITDFLSFGTPQEVQDVTSSWHSNTPVIKHITLPGVLVR